MTQIIGTNEVVHTVSRFNSRSGRSETIRTVLPVGRIIAEHQTQEITNKHCAKLKRCHPTVKFHIKQVGD